jgi:hypothetical protein
VRKDASRLYKFAGDLTFDADRSWFLNAERLSRVSLAHWLYQSAVSGSRAASDLEQAIRFEKSHHFRFHLRALLFLARALNAKPFLQQQLSPSISR